MVVDIVLEFAILYFMKNIANWDKLLNNLLGRWWPLHVCLSLATAGVSLFKLWAHWVQKGDHHC